MAALIIQSAEAGVHSVMSPTCGEAGVNPWQEQWSRRRSSRRHYSPCFCNWKMGAIRERGSVCEIISCLFFPSFAYLNVFPCATNMLQRGRGKKVYLRFLQVEEKLELQLKRASNSSRDAGIFINFTFAINCLPHFPQAQENFLWRWKWLRPQKVIVYKSLFVFSVTHVWKWMKYLAPVQPCWGSLCSRARLLPAGLEDVRWEVVQVNFTLISCGQKTDLTRGMSALERRAKWGSITEQRSGRGGGRVSIIEEIGGGKLSSFVSHPARSGCCFCSTGTSCRMRVDMKLTSRWDASAQWWSQFEWGFHTSPYRQ